MSATLFLVLGIAFVLAWVPLVVGLARSYWRFRGVRLVVCPETVSPETVTLDAKHAAWTSMTDTPDLRLASCSRQPEVCAQGCLEQIEASPEDSLVRERLKRWWEESTCATCHRPIGRVRWLGRRPGLLGPGRTVRSWRDLTAESLPELLATHRPVCARCVAVARTGAAKQPGTAA